VGQRIEGDGAALPIHLAEAAQHGAQRFRHARDVLLAHKTLQQRHMRCMGLVEREARREIRLEPRVDGPRPLNRRGIRFEKHVDRNQLHATGSL
jgi:hypothetical protein